MAGPNTGTPDDVQAIIDQAVNGTDPNTAPPTDATSGAVVPTTNTGPRNQSSDILSLVIAKKGAIARTENVSAATVKNPLTGLSAPNPYPTYRYWWPDGSYLDITGSQQGGFVKGGTALKALSASASGPKTTVSGAGTGDQFIIQTDPTTGNITTQPNPNYIEPARSQPKALVSGANTTDATISILDPSTGQVSFQPNPNYVNPATTPITPYQQATLQQQAARDNVDAYYRSLSNQVAMGQLSNSEAIRQFQEVVDQFNAQRDMLTSAQSAGNDAAKYAQMATVNQVGPNFGANFARGLQGVAQGDPSLVSYGPNDFTYPTPDYAGIAAKAQAAVLARLAPYAARLGQTTYTPQPAQPDVLSQAANSVVSQAPPYQPAQNRQ